MSGNRNIPRALNNRISRREQEVVSMNTSMAPCTDSSRVELVVDVLGQFGEARLRVVGSSMLPAIWPGDVLTIRRCPMGEVR